MLLGPLLLVPLLRDHLSVCIFAVTTVAGSNAAETIVAKSIVVVSIVSKSIVI